MDFLAKPNTGPQALPTGHHQLALAPPGNSSLDFNTLLLGGADQQPSHHIGNPVPQQQIYAPQTYGQEENLPPYGLASQPPSTPKVASAPASASTAPQLLSPQQQQPSYPSYPAVDAKEQQPEYARSSSSSNGSHALLSSPPMPLYQQPQPQPAHPYLHQQQQQQHALPAPPPNRQPQPQLQPPPPQQHPQVHPLGSYPTVESSATTGRDPVQSLLDAYPNPQTENQKIVKMLEVIAAHMQEQYKRFDNFMSSVEERLGGLEAAVSQLVLNDPELAKRLEREKMERERERDRERSAPRSPPLYYASKPAKNELKKKKKKKIIPEYEKELSRSTAPDLGYRSPATDEVDEELARKLQAQFNAEAEIEALKKESIALSDEEYAQKLQSLYLKRDVAAGQASKRGTSTPAPASTAAGAKKETAAATAKKPDSSGKPEEKSLWSRLFGAPKSDSDEESDEEESKPSKKTEVTTTYPLGGTVRAPATAQPAASAGASGTPAAQGQQVMAVPYYYPGMPQQQFMIPQGMPQYAPYPMALQPGAQYLYPAATAAQPAPQ